MKKITTINVRVDEDLKDRVKLLADSQNMTISEMVRGWFIDCVERAEQSSECLECRITK